MEPEQAIQNERQHYRSTIVTWHAREYDHIIRPRSWYLKVMFVGIVVAAGAVYFDDVLFALVALVGVGVMILYALKTPDIVKYTISKKGVQIGSRLYPFDNIDSFYIHELDEPVIVLHTNRSFMPILTIPIIGIESAHVHDILSYYVPEEHTAIPTSEHISKAIGF